jgi:hypothetical protein
MLLTGELNPIMMCAYKNMCLGYFKNKDIPADKQVHKILSGLHDTCIQDWTFCDRDVFITMTFVNFMKKFKSVYLPEDWEEIMCIKLLGMTQGTNLFWNFVVQIQTKNSLLCDTPSHLTKEQLRHHIESGMFQKLALCCHLEKSSKTVEFEKWLSEIKHVNNLLHTKRSKFEAIAKASCKSSR